MNRLISIDDISRQDIENIFCFSNRIYKNEAFVELNSCRGVVVANLFLELSTRTRNSFEIAEKKLGMISITPAPELSSLGKNESELDMVLNLEAMGVKLLVVRHPKTDFIYEISNNTSLKIINAGSGSDHHPTQTLIDLFTIQQLKKYEDMKLAIVGDLAHSRVAKSLIKGLTKFNVKQINLIAPKELQLNELHSECVHKFNNLKDGLHEVDVVYCLRIQNERIKDPINIKNFIKDYQINKKTISYAKKDAIIMHPGPVNREVEISNDVLISKESVILKQVRNSVPIRSALLFNMLHGA